MTWVVLMACAVLAAVATAGVLRPFAGPRRAVVRLPADPLEDERRGLIRALRDLDEQLSRGELTEASYREFRRDAESRAVSVLRALEGRDGLPAAELREIRMAAGRPQGGPGERRSGRVVTGVLLASAVLAAMVPLLAGAVRDRAPGQPITGGALASDPDPLVFFEQRVRDHPRDVAARLDLARRYMDIGEVRPAIEQYVATLELDPGNPEARASLGFLLYLAGEPEEGLASVEEALEADPDFPEALYFKGVILLRGLDRPDLAAPAFRAYLDGAPFGSRRAEVERLLEEAGSGD
jgi:tetratricopeptide (TPR) repeat protein